MLVEVELLHPPVLYLSRYIIDTKNDYHRLLRGVTAEATWEQWVLYVLRGVEQTSRETTRKINAIRTLQDDFAGRARDVTRGATDAAFQAILFEQPYCRIQTVMNRCDVSRPTASGWLHALVAAGLLRSVKAGRERLFVNHEFLALLVRREPIGSGRTHPAVTSRSRSNF